MDEQIKQILALVAQPAFLACEGEVRWCNGAAHGLLGMPLCDLMEDHGALFSLWNRQGRLQLPLILRGEAYDASVCAVDEGDLFIATARAPQRYAAADAMVQASASLRRTLHNMMGAARSLFDTLEDQNDPNAAQMNRALYQLVRLCGQLSDGGQLLRSSRSARRRPTDMNAFFDTFASNLKPLLESTGRSFRYVPLGTAVRADIDEAMMERALYNLISNALHYTPMGGEITLQAEKRELALLVQICDNGEGIAPEVLTSLFERYDAMGGDARRGTGLGLPIAREIIRLHGGTMTVTANSSGVGTAVTFTLSLAPAPIELHSRTLCYDNWGDLHHGLVELSDVLDAELYDPQEVL